MSDIDDTTRKLYHLEREIATHSRVLAQNAEAMKNLAERSDERLDYIRNEFREVKELIRADRLEAKAARDRIVGAASATFLAFVTAVWFVIVEPMHDQLAVLERRLLDVEKRIEVSYPLDDSDHPQ